MDLFRRSDRAWMSNPQMLAVGIDVPEMQGVAVVSSMSSPVNIAQILGRPLRMNPNCRLKKAIIMTPFFMDEMDDADDAANAALWDSGGRSKDTGTGKDGNSSAGSKGQTYKWEGTHDEGLEALKEFCEKM